MRSGYIGEPTKSGIIRLSGVAVSGLTGQTTLPVAESSTGLTDMTGIVSWLTFMTGLSLAYLDLVEEETTRFTSSTNNETVQNKAAFAIDSDDKLD